MDKLDKLAKLIGAIVRLIFFVVAGFLSYKGMYIQVIAFMALITYPEICAIRKALEERK